MQAHIVVDGKIESHTSADDVKKAHAAGRRMWVDLEERTPDTERLLLDTFKIHPLIVEDIWLDRSVPKIDEFDDYLYVIVHGVRRGSSPTKVELYVLDIVIGRTFVITQHRDPIAAEAARDMLIRAPRLLEEGTPWFAHAIIDYVVDRFLPLIDKLGAKIDRIEADVVENAGTAEGKDLLSEMFALKRSIQALSRITTHQREILHRLSRSEFDEIPKKAIPYFRDVYDHFVRVSELADSYRDLVLNAMDAYLSVQSNRMNETVKTLTLMSTVMLPLTFIAGVYGMNFRHMPEVYWTYGYPFALGLMATVAISIVLFFKRKRWL
jgi:magnesium transporter